MGEYVNTKEIEVFLEEYLIYLRKSRSDNPKETPEETLARHEVQLQEHAKRELGHTIEERNIYREVISGGEDLASRPEFLKVLHRLEKGNIKGVLVVDPQRLSRSGMYGAGDVIEAFEVTHTKIVTPNKTYDLKNKYDKKFIEMELMQGAEYLNYVKEKLAIGRMTSVKEGKFVGSVPPFGYDKEKLQNDKGFKLVINDTEAQVVRFIFDLCLEGSGTSTIANTMNKLSMDARKGEVWTPAMIRNILENPTYYGMLTWQKNKLVKKLKNGSFIIKKEKQEDFILVKGLHDPIISEEEYNAVQYKLRNSNHPRRPSNINQISNPLAGIVKCSKCGRSMIRRPFNTTTAKNPKRLHDINKPALLALLREHKEQSGLSINQIKDKLNVSRDQVVSWFTSNINRFYVSKTFSDKWFEIKELLNITIDEYDEPLTSFVFTKCRPDTLMCPLTGCETVASDLHLVEERLLKLLEERLKEYRYYLSNYEEEIVKEAKNNANQLSKIEVKIEKLKKALKNIRRDYNMELFSYEEYMEDKTEYESELKDLENIRDQLLNTDDEDKMIKYKKAIPKIQDCLDKYYTYNVEEKNEILKTLINKVIYTKTENGRWNPNATFYLELHTKI